RASAHRSRMTRQALRAAARSDGVPVPAPVSVRRRRLAIATAAHKLQRVHRAGLLRQLPRALVTWQRTMWLRKREMRQTQRAQAWAWQVRLTCGLRAAIVKDVYSNSTLSRFR